MNNGFEFKQIAGWLHNYESEIASCTLSLKVKKVTEGHELGSFHLGGPSHCLISGSFNDLEFDKDTIVPVNPVAPKGELLARH